VTAVSPASSRRNRGIPLRRRIPSSSKGHSVTSSASRFRNGARRRRFPALCRTPARVSDHRRGRYLAGLKKLRKLNLMGTSVTDIGLAVAGLGRDGRHRCATGEAVAVRATAPPVAARYRGGRCRIAASDRLKELEELNLSNTTVTGKGIESLRGLTNLRTVKLANTYYEGEGLEHLGAVEDLDLHGSSVGNAAIDRDYGEIYDAGQAKLAGLTKLTGLTLDSTHITGASVATLKGVAGLRSLNLYHTLVSKPAFEELKTALPQCRIVWDAASNLPNRRRS